MNTPATLIAQTVEAMLLQLGTLQGFLPDSALPPALLEVDALLNKLDRELSSPR